MAQGHRDYYLKTLGIDEYLPKDLEADNEMPVVEILEAASNQPPIDAALEPISAQQVAASFDIPSDMPTILEQPNGKPEPLTDVEDDPFKRKGRSNSPHRAPIGSLAAH